MIFLTIGTQLPFDRLVRDVDQAAAQVSEKIVGQVGLGKYKPIRVAATAFMEPSQFEQCLAQSRVVISHAGIGTILTCLRHKKPLIAMDRQARLREHRNDHQSATLSELSSLTGLHPAKNAGDIVKYLQQDCLAPMHDAPSKDLEGLLAFIRSEIVGP